MTDMRLRWRGTTKMQDEIERLRAELAEFTELKEYAKSLDQETYLELHARNERLTALNAELVAALESVKKCGGNYGLAQAWEIARAALAKVKEWK